MSHTIAPPWMWAAFFVFVVLATLVDLLGLKRSGSKVVGMRQALLWSMVWISLALVFSVLLWFWLDASVGRIEANLKTTQFLTGYVIEKALSVDNIFVFLMLFSAFAVPAEMQKRALIVGVIGALLLRATMIFLGAWLVAEFAWILYVFGAFLLFTGIKMMFFAEHEPDLENNLLLKWMRNHLAISKNYEGNQLSFMHEGKRWFTPLFVVVALIGITDVIFAVDSIPAIFAITTDPFIVLTSNVFAVLGLRALYFLLAGMAARFHLLSYGLALVLAFVGGKMLLPIVSADLHLPIGYALAVIVGILATTIVFSMFTTPRRKKHK